ncbi:MAG: hypothetical protein Q4G52_05020 [Clostridia bacterium]|nr:hypothetical protein [Clostridia bacterium]
MPAIAIAPKTTAAPFAARETVFSPSFYKPYEEAVTTALMLICQAREQLFEETGGDVSAMTFRLKSPASIRDKLIKKGLPVSAAAARAALHDIAGLRVVLASESQVYRLAAILENSPAVQLTDERDYIAAPKESGYRSLHLLLNVPVLLRSGAAMMVPVELQLRTASMDIWASIEHDRVYKPVCLPT